MEEPMEVDEANDTTSCQIQLLPKDGAMGILRSMDYRTLFVFSSLSTKTKNLVKRLNLKATKTEIRIRAFVTFQFHLFEKDFQWTFYMEDKDREAIWKPEPLPIPETCILAIRDEGDAPDWDIPNAWDLKMWLNYFREILHFSKFDKLNFCSGALRWDGASLKEAIGDNYKLMSFYENHLPQVVRTFILKFQPKELYLEGGVYQNQKNILSLEYDHLMIEVDKSPPVKLDHVLTMNAKKLRLMDADNFTDQEINRYLKIWMKGESNKKMETMAIVFDAKNREISREEVLKGIPFREQSQDELRVYKISCEEEPVILVGGCDIQNKNGVKATVSVSRSEDHDGFFMKVWHPHSYNVI